MRGGWLLVATAVLAFIVSRYQRPSVPNLEVNRLREEAERLRAKVRAYEALSHTDVLGSQTSRSAHLGTATAAAGGPSLVTELLDLHSHWDWQAIAHEMLQPFQYINEDMIAAGVRECYQNGTMYCMRAQIVSNELYITDYRAVFFDRHYAPARVMPLLDVLRRHTLPDIELVVAAVDEPRIKTKVDARDWSLLMDKYPGSIPRGNVKAQLPPPLFSSTVDRAHLDLAWPDFSFYMPRRPHKLRTPPWSKLHPRMLEQSAALRWEDKVSLAVHTGNVGSPYRKRLAAEAVISPGEILVNELFIGDHGRINSTCAQINRHRTGGYQKHLCYMTFTEQCSYK